MKLGLKKRLQRFPFMANVHYDVRLSKHVVSPNAHTCFAKVTFPLLKLAIAFGVAHHWWTKPDEYTQFSCLLVDDFEHVLESLLDLHGWMSSWLSEFGWISPKKSPTSQHFRILNLQFVISPTIGWGNLQLSPKASIFIVGCFLLIIPMVQRTFLGGCWWLAHGYMMTQLADYVYNVFFLNTQWPDTYPFDT